MSRVSRFLPKPCHDAEYRTGGPDGPSGSVSVTQCHVTAGHGQVQIALVGNSHAGQWLLARQVLARQHGWTLTTYLTSQCNATDAQLEFYSLAKTAGCLDSGRWTTDQTRGTAFDLVITTERQSIPTLGDNWSTTMSSAVAGYRSYLQRRRPGGDPGLVRGVGNASLMSSSPGGRTVRPHPPLKASRPETEIIATTAACRNLGGKRPSWPPSSYLR